MQKKDKNLLSIGEAADFLEVSINTLRLWDAAGKLKAQRSPGGHRYYAREQLRRFTMDLKAMARVWAESATAPALPADQYCETQDVFRARLETMSSVLEQGEQNHNLTPLLTAVTGEIGNNSFDHNFGNWPDLSGIFFGYDPNRQVVVLADRGQGIKATLLRVRPDLGDDLAAMHTAFTERVSGRSPEQRGNGLKFVSAVATKYPIGVTLQSGTALAVLAKEEGKLAIKLADRYLRGTLAVITY